MTLSDPHFSDQDDSWFFRVLGVVVDVQRTKKP